MHNRLDENRGYEDRRGYEPPSRNWDDIERDYSEAGRRRGEGEAYGYNDRYENELDYDRGKPSAVPPVKAASEQKKTHQELSKKILSIFSGTESSAGDARPAPNSSASPYSSAPPVTSPYSSAPPVTAPAPAPPPPPPPSSSAAAAASSGANLINFDNPNVQKALDSLIQSGPNLLKSITPKMSAGSTSTSISSAAVANALAMEGGGSVVSGEMGQMAHMGQTQGMQGVGSHQQQQMMQGVGGMGVSADQQLQQMAGMNSDQMQAMGGFDPMQAMNLEQIQALGINQQQMQSMQGMSLEQMQRMGMEQLQGGGMNLDIMQQGMAMNQRQRQQQIQGMGQQPQQQQQRRQQRMQQGMSSGSGRQGMTSNLPVSESIQQLANLMMQGAGMQSFQGPRFPSNSQTGGGQQRPQLPPGPAQPPPPPPHQNF